MVDHYHSDRYLELSDSELNNVSTSQLIATTFKVYGSVFGICFILFLILRATFPTVYAFNSTARGQLTDLSKDRHGYVNWIWKIFQTTDEEIFHSCGFSAIVYLRFLRLGFKLSAWGIFNSIYLIPINLYGCQDSDDPCFSLADAFNRFSVSNISANNPSFLATTFAAYVIFGKAMHYIFQEFRWFTEYRHKFSIKKRPDNYTVYVAHIPEEYRSDIALLEYFRSIFSHDDVLEAKIALDIFNLDKKVARRNTVVKKLEHAINIRTEKGYEPTYMADTGAELHKLNEEISGVITEIETAKEDEKNKFMRAMLLANGIKCNSDLSNASFDRGDKLKRLSSSRHLLKVDFSEDDEVVTTDGGFSSKRSLNVSDVGDVDNNTPPDSMHEGLEELASDSDLLVGNLNSFNSENEPFIKDGVEIDTSLMTTPKSSPKTGRKHKRNLTFQSIGSATSKHLGKAVVSGKKIKKRVGNSVEFVGKYSTKFGQTVAGGVNNSAILVKRVAGKTVKKSYVNVKDLAVFSAQLATDASSRLKRLLLNTDDGKVRESGFVTFTNLSTKAQCAQIIHHEAPYQFLVKDAPLPKDIIWDNVGRSHEEIQAGYLLANAATVGLMILWTIPVAFFTSLSETESLKEVLPALEKAIDNNPWVAMLLGQLSPLLLVILTELLPVVLSVVCTYEGHIGRDTWDASLLVKISLFMVIQIFFVQAISGSIFDELKKMIKDSSLIIDLLATSIPTQVKSFIQFILVQMFLGCSIEILRVVRVAMALARRKVGPNLTEKERNEAYFFLKPITEPEEMEYPMRYSEMVLYFMVNLVYSCVAPIMSYFVMLTFGILSVVHRHQLIYIYSSKNDKGGKLWPQVIMLLIACMFVSEITLIAILSIKKGAMAAVLLAPLFGATVVFLVYIQQEHFRITKFVPSTLCKASDIINHATLDISSFNDQYLQPSLKSKRLFPENDVGNIGQSLHVPRNSWDSLPASGDFSMHSVEEGTGDNGNCATSEQIMGIVHEGIIVDRIDEVAGEASDGNFQPRDLDEIPKEGDCEHLMDDDDIACDKNESFTKDVSMHSMEEGTGDNGKFSSTEQIMGIVHEGIIVDRIEEVAGEASDGNFQPRDLGDILKDACEHPKNDHDKLHDIDTYSC